MASFFKDNPDLQYYFEKGIDWQPLVELLELGFRDPDGFHDLGEAVDFYREIAELVGEFVAEELAPRAAEIDRQGLKLVDGEVVLGELQQALTDRLDQLELHGMCLPRELDGMNVPLLIYFINCELMARGDVSVMSHHGFHLGIAMAMLALSIMEGTTTVDKTTGKIIDTRFREAIGEIARGEAWGCMDITEPDAGSDMAALRARAEQDEEGNWYLTGQKIFITSGHGKYHFVIARSEDPENPETSGLKGLSMFLVPTYREGEHGQRVRLATVERVEEKLGHHASATCTVSFERTPAYLVGARGDGFRFMLQLMNNARLGVGFEAIGLCEAAYRMARDYAAERPSMGKTLDRHEMIADYLDEMDIDIRGLRALAMSGAWHQEMATRLDFNKRFGLMEDELANQRDLAEHEAESRRLTPLLKYLAAEKAVAIARRCLQIHGGNGYMKEYGAEKLLRDALVLPIYEGTSQIQALMAMKDTLAGIIKNPQEFVKRLAQTRWHTLSARDPLERRVARIQQLSLATQQHLITRTAANKLRALSGKPLPSWPRAFMAKWDPKRDFAYAMLHAERLTQLLADEAICEILLEQARKHPERRELLERYLERAEPRCRLLHEEITTTGKRLLESLHGTQESDSSQAAG